MRKVVCVFSVLMTVSFLFSSCASGPKARLTEWRNNELTICCNPGKKSCTEKDWEKAAAPYCAGNVKMVGGRMSEDVSGYQATPTNDKKRFELQAQRVPTSCRLFECQGSVIPPAE